MPPVRLPKMTPTTERGWTARKSELEHWEAFLDAYIDEASHGAMNVTIAETGEPDTHPNWSAAEVFERSFEARQGARAMAADFGETSQFLHSKHLTLEPTARELFVDFVSRDLYRALRLFIRRAKGDYSEDEHPKQFPEFERTADPGLTAWKLFERFVERMKPARSTAKTWGTVFLKLQKDFPNHSAAMFTPEEIKTWLEGLITEHDQRIEPRLRRSAKTVNGTWRVAGRRVFGWGVDQKLISRNPFTDVRVPVTRKRTNRETKAFTDDEIKIILTASSAIISSPQLSKRNAVRRWVPWICAYTGARPGEITQLRGSDVIWPNAANAIRITPEAGTVKNRKPRTVPLHEHLIDEGFLDFVKASGRGPLFYNEAKDKPAEGNLINSKKPRSEIARTRLAEWVRKTGVTDPEVKPNHAWRETFKQIGHRYEISERILDAIAGHAPISVGRGYGLPTLADMAAALKKFPRYDIE
jgi:integrase